jgi:Na+-translocating ferredoxin:NAD+ oxidoreductase RnfE subunit
MPPELPTRFAVKDPLLVPVLALCPVLAAAAAVTSTVVLCDTDVPLEPTQVMVNVVVDDNASVVVVPEGDALPDHPPEAVQLEMPDDDHVSVEVAPMLTAAG